MFVGRKVEGKDVSGEEGEDVIFKNLFWYQLMSAFEVILEVLKPGVGGEFEKGLFLSPWRCFITFALEGFFFLKEEGMYHPNFTDL